MEKEMRRLCGVVLIVFALMAGACAEQSAAANSAGLPDAAELFRRLEANQKEIEERRKNYICDFNEETQKLDSGNGVKKSEVKGYEMFFVAGSPIVRMVSKEGRALSEDETRKENERVEKEIRKAKERAEKRERDEADKDTLTVEQFLRGSRFHNGRYADYKGRRLLAYDFDPNPDYKPRTRAETLVSKLGGTVWIDPDALQVARLEARLVGTFKVAGGLFGSVHEGSDLVLAQERVNDELWMPSYVDFNVDARVLLVKGVHERIIDKFSNYRKFRVETRIQ
jgi:hypothetical protein